MKVLRLTIGSVILLILMTTVSLGQQSIGNLFVNNEQRGDEMFEDLYYNQAITYYKLALKRQPENRQLTLKVANSYRLLSAYDQSLVWYERAFENDFSPEDSIHRLYYADVLVSAARFDEAKKYYREYEKVAPLDSRSARKLQSLEHISWLFEDSSLLELSLPDFNSKYNDLGALRYEDGLLFLSARPTATLADQDFLREENLLDFFYTEYDSLLGWKSVTRVNSGLNSNYFEGPATLSADQKAVIFSRSNIILGKPVRNSSGKTQVQLFTASRVAGEWVVGNKLSFCDSEYSYVDPALNPMGDTLYFSSDMAGGYGGNDIYMSIKSEDKWGQPVNLGPLINTEGNELYPFFIEDRLFFSSNGQGGLGGYDVYKAYLSGGTVQGVANLAMPVNSAFDDFAYSIEPLSLRGFFTSNRTGGLGDDDIYAFETRARVLAGIVTQEQNGSPIAGATVQLEQYGRDMNEVITDSLGQFRFQLPIGEEFDINVSKEGHRAILPVHIPNTTNQLDLDSVMISLHKDDLFARGRILDNETQKLMDEVRVVLHNATDNDFDTLLTDENGTYSFVLLPDKTFNIWATKAGYIFGEANINTYEIDTGVIINDIVLELEYEKKNLVYFEFDKYDLSSEARSILRRTAQAMKRTTHQVIVSAYADARGTVEYNQKLSDKRAEEVLNYLIANGVDRSRIVARGFGEALILNRCVDGVNCEEVEHSKNRRAEIKIEGSNVK